MLSLPPIINGTHSKISKDTRNCFIECTAVDIAKAQTVLNVIVSLFSLHCEEPFTVESVQVVYEEQPGRIDAGTHTYPTLEPRIAHASMSTINRVAGVELVRPRARGAKREARDAPPPPPLLHAPCVAPCYPRQVRMRCAMCGFSELPNARVCYVCGTSILHLRLVRGPHRTSWPFWPRTAPRAAVEVALARPRPARVPFWGSAPLGLRRGRVRVERALSLPRRVS